MRIDQSVQLVKSYLAKGEYKKVIVFSQKVLQEHPNLPMIYYILGQALEEEGATEAARNAYLKAVNLQPDFVDARVFLAQLCQSFTKSERLDEAVFHYQEVLKFRPNWAQVYYNLGVVFFRLAYLHKAIEAYQKAIELQPDYDRAYFNLALVFDSLGDHKRAIAAYEDVIERVNSVQYKLDAYNNLGALFLRLDRRDEAIAIFQEGIKLQPDGAGFYNNLGQALWYNDKDGAIEAFEQAIKFDPRMILAHYNLGKAWQVQGFYQVSIVSFQKVIELDPTHRGAYTDCGFSYLMMGEFEQAFIYLQKVLAIQSQFLQAYCHNVSLQTEEDELTLAQKSCVQFLRDLIGIGKNPVVSASSKLDNLPGIDVEKLVDNMTQIYLHLGNALLEYENYEQAENYYRQALHFSVNFPEVYVKLAYCLMKQKRYHSAMIFYQLALKIQPDSFLYMEVGKFLEKQGQWEKAIEFYQRAFKENQLEKSQPRSFPTLNLKSIDVPQGIYSKTLDWFEKQNLPQNYYIEILRKEDTNLPLLETDFQISFNKKSYECGGLTCSICLWEMRKWFKPTHLGWGIYSCFTEEKIPIKDYPNFVAIIPEGKAWIVPTENYWKVCKAIAVITSDNYLLGDLSRDYPSKLPVCPQDNPGQHLIFKEVDLPPLERLDETVVILSGLSGNVYFHWMVDILPRIEILRQGGVNFEKIDKFVVNSYQQPFQRKTLEWLGIPEEKILESDRYPYIQAKELICPSFPGYLGWPSPWVIDFLRREFLGKIYQQIRENYPDKIYISRSQSRYRKVFNEPEVIEVLQESGFVSVCLESLPLEEQISLFYHAKVVVSPHGSGLTNLIFCQPGTKIIELMSPHYIGHYYWGISNVLNLQHYYLIGETIDCYVLRELMYTSPLIEDLLIDINALKRMLKLIGL